MIKYDGHDCWHELLNNKKQSALDLIRVQRRRLSLTDEICVEVSFLNIGLITNGFFDIEKDFPNIKYAMLYRTRKNFLDPKYSRIQDIQKFEKWKNHIHKEYNIKIDFIDLDFSKEQSMDMDTWRKSYEYISNLYWVDNGNDYFSTDPSFPTTYYKWFEILSFYNPSFTIEQYHNMIKKNLREYPDIYPCLENEIL